MMLAGPLGVMTKLLLLSLMASLSDSQSSRRLHLNEK